MGEGKVVIEYRLKALKRKLMEQKLHRMRSL